MDVDEFDSGRFDGWVHVGAPVIGERYDGSDKP